MQSQTLHKLGQFMTFRRAGWLIFNCLMLSLFANVVDAQPMQAPRVQPSNNSQLVRFSGDASGQPGAFNTMGDESSYLESRVANLEAQLQSLQTAPQNYNGDSNCNSCGKPGFYFGAAAIWAKPHFKESFEFSQTNVTTGQQTLVPFEYDYDATPMIWVGFNAANGVGLRATYWNFDADGETRTNISDGLNIFGAHAVTIIFPANIFAAIPGSSLTTSSSLETSITNLYATYDATFNTISISGGVGLRYARLRQRLSAVVSGPAPASLNWTREYYGLGPSMMLDMRKRLGCSRFSGIAKGGGALLFGTKTIDRTVFGDQSPQPASPFLSLDEADEVVGIGEFGFGLEWSKRTARGARFSVAGTYDGQLWAEAGAPTLGFLGFQGFGVHAELRR